MAIINENFFKLKDNYLFAEIAARVAKYQSENPTKTLIKLGIGDVTIPLSKSVIAALHEAADEMGNKKTFQGYGPYEGHEFLRSAIAQHAYQNRGVEIHADEIFVSDGAKSDMGNILDLFGEGNIIGITDPVYPAYVDSNTISNGGDTIIYLPCSPENGFAPTLPKTKLDIIYLCSPNNPTGCALNTKQLTQWVEYANQNDALILFDGAYEAYITSEGIPHSIFEIPGAKNCAIEFRSFSKNAGFTGMRCGYVTIPKQLKRKNKQGNEVALGALWLRRQATKYNGNSYPIQKAAAAIYSESGKVETAQMIQYYMENAKIIVQALKEMGLTVYGGVDAPYIWLQIPEGLTSWEFFDKLLHEANVVGTPGVGFGQCGEGYLRLTAFGSRENTLEALERIKKQLKL